MTKKRSPGHGSVTARKDGRFWTRAPRLPDGRRPSLGVYPTFDEAEGVRAAAVNQLADADLSRLPGTTLRAFGERWLDEHEHDDRSAPHRRARWTHIVKAPFIEWRLETIGRPAVIQWIKTLRKTLVTRGTGPGAKPHPIARATVRVIVGFLSTLFSAACEEGLCPTNPADRIRIASEKRVDIDDDEAEVWTYLDADEQRRLLTCASIPETDRLIIAFAIGTGLRLGEQMNLELRDLHVEGDDPHVFVRWGSKGRRPKNGKTRRVPLFGLGLAAARRWLEVLPTYAPENPLALVFPTARGNRRHPSKHLQRQRGKRIRVDGFREALLAAGIARPVRWHDLRHTCASSLVSGAWGPVWALYEVKDILGHTSVRITERYAHLAPATVTRIAARTGGLHGVRMGEGGAGAVRALPAASGMDRPLAAAAAHGTRWATAFRAISEGSGGDTHASTLTAIEGLRAVARGDEAAACAAAVRLVVGDRPVMPALCEVFEAVLDAADAEQAERAKGAG